MKIKDLERTVNVAWSPASQYPILLAAGTAAQQLDASFNTNAALEIYSLNLSDPGMDLELKTSISSDNRFYKIVWGSHGNSKENNDGSGIVIGGCDGGIIQIYNAAKLLSGEECLISKPNTHNGAVQALDLNPFQNNLLASGASESEIFIWDLNNTTTPMSPGSKSQPYEMVQCVAWNRQVQHILATTFSARCVVWDLRKNEPIIKLTDTSSHIRWKYVSWHPEVATQLCLASEEDQTPVIQLWDLRFATSPLKVLDNHQRGVLAVAWCAQDSDLLISCGKDNRILCWNPNSNEPRGEVLSEIAQTLEWNFDVAWCPRNPALIAASSFDGHVSVYSLMGGKQAQVQTSNKIADSFPGMDGYVQAPLPQQLPPVSVDLSKPPKWLKRPVGASFGFGGKLITFENEKPNVPATTTTQPQPVFVNRQVHISQVITEPELIEKANELEQSLQSGDYLNYCRQKADSSKNQHERYVWHFLKANFEENPKLELLNLLGFYPNDMNNALSDHLAKKTRDQLNISSESNETVNDQSVLNESSYNSTPTRKLSVPFKIKTGNDIDGLIAQAILVGNIEAAVDLCLESNRMADALIIAMTGGPDLLARTQHRYLEKTDGYVSALIAALVSEDWSSIINQCDVNSWKEALAAALTYCTTEDLPLLCERLGERLEAESNGNKKLLEDAQLCYICAGSFNKLVTSWSDGLTNASVQSDSQKLQELVELITFMQKSIEHRGHTVDVSGNLADLLASYAKLLASQGNLNTALNYLGSSTDPSINELRERLYYNLGHKNIYQQQQQQHQQQQQQQQHAYGTRSHRTSFSSSQQPLTPQPQSQPQMMSPLIPAPLGGNMNQPSKYPAMSQPMSAMPPPPPKTYSPGPPPLSTTPSQSSLPRTSSASTTRSKYVLDPSVASPGYNMQPVRQVPSAANVMGPTSMAMTPPITSGPMPSAFPPNPSNFNTYATTTPSTQLPPPPVPAPGGVSAGVGPVPLIPSASNTNQMMYNNANNLYNNSNNQMNNISTSNNNNNNMEIGQPAIPLLQPLSSAPGWNDPPAVSKTYRSQQPKTDAPLPAPITHPLYGANIAEPMGNEFGMQNNTFNGGGPPMSVPSSMPYGQMPMQQQQQQQQQLPPQSFQQPMPVMPPQQTPTPKPATPTPNITAEIASKVKEPMPEEHMYLQTVFNELQTQCACAANNPQTKRKLEDVTRKLEAMYDMIRQNKLSPQTLASLHNLVQMVQIGDYTNGLGLHTQLVSGPDFAQIASFMPGLKVLLQCALQLQVYLR